MNRAGKSCQNWVFRGDIFQGQRNRIKIQQYLHCPLQSGTGGLFLLSLAITCSPTHDLWPQIYDICFNVLPIPSPCTVARYDLPVSSSSVEW